MMKKVLCLLLVALFTLTMFAGCGAPTVVWVSEDDPEATGEAVIVTQAGDEQSQEEGKEEQNEQQGGNGNKTIIVTSRRQKTTTVKGAQTTNGGPKTRATKPVGQTINYTPVADAGANYKVKGNVSIAVDTVRPTDYDAMFDVLQKLYPNINFTFDFWARSGGYDDAREYLATRIATGSAANVIWDEAGEMPAYLAQGWVEPITKYVAKDPEAKNIPANLKKDYTYFGDLFAVPHQATFETVAFNTDLMPKLGLKMPKLNWTYDDYTTYLRKGGAGFSQKICVGISDLFEAYDRYSFYSAIKNGGNYSERAYNYDTNQLEYEHLKAGAKKFREWREIPGAEGWFQQKGGNTSAGNLLEQQLGVSSYESCWNAGRALMEDSLTAVAEGWDSLKFNWKQWPAPNRDGRMMLHVDQCFITRGTPKADMEACFQVLRFMTYSTNGNLARLSMYKDSEKGKYSLNSHVYYPTSKSKKVIEAFNALPCTDECDEYLVKNIPNSCRFDSFKLVPEWRDLTVLLKTALNNVTDGLDDGSGLAEPVSQFNKEMKRAWKDFEAEYNERYK